MQTIRKCLFAILGSIGVVFLLIGMGCLDKKQRKNLSILLDELSWSVDNLAKDSVSIEDKMFEQEVGLTRTDYAKGTNEDLSVECRMCGEVTPRGKYYKRVGVETNEAPYLVICEDCYKSLPLTEEYLTSHWLFNKGGEE